MKKRCKNTGHKQLNTKKRKKTRVITLTSNKIKFLKEKGVLIVKGRVYKENSDVNLCITDLLIVDKYIKYKLLERSGQFC